MGNDGRGRHLATDNLQVPSTVFTLSWPQEIVSRAMVALEPAADEARGAEMSAYMRDLFPFLGIQTPQRTALLKDAWADLPKPTPTELAEAVTELWDLHGREYQYAACDLLGMHLGTPRRAARYSPFFLTDVIGPLVTTKSWWDTVDSLRAVAVGPLVLAHPELKAVMRAWADDENHWLVRSALIHQLGYKAQTDEELLFDLCAQHAGNREFFVGKAIGWALRTYARQAPDAVRRFCEDHPDLTRLARREALKHL